MKGDQYYVLKHFHWLLSKDEDLDIFDPGREGQYNRHFQKYMTLNDPVVEPYAFDRIFAPPVDHVFNSHCVEGIEDLISPFLHRSGESVHLFDGTVPERYISFVEQLFSCFIICSRLILAEDIR